MTTPMPDRQMIEPHLSQLLHDDPEHLRLTRALASAREALGPSIPPEVLAYIDASTDLLTHDLGVEAALMFETGKVFGGAVALDTHWRGGGVATQRGIASLLSNDVDADPMEAALRMAMETLRAR